MAFVVVVSAKIRAYIYSSTLIKEDGKIKVKTLRIRLLLVVLPFSVLLCGCTDRIMKGKVVLPPAAVGDVQAPLPSDAVETRPSPVEAPAPADEVTAEPSEIPQLLRDQVQRRKEADVSFPDVLVQIGTARICIGTACHPALVGVATPRGEFQLIHYSTPDPGYGGDILAFKETPNDLYAIHRVINVPGQHRLARLKSKDPKRRNTITGGCINVDPSVYDELVKCCYGSKLIIK